MERSLKNNMNNNSNNNFEIFDLDMQQENLNQSVLESKDLNFINELKEIKSIKF